MTELDKAIEKCGAKTEMLRKFIHLKLCTRMETIHGCVCDARTYFLTFKILLMEWVARTSPVYAQYLFTQHQLDEYTALREELADRLPRKDYQMLFEPDGYFDIIHEFKQRTIHTHTTICIVDPSMKSLGVDVLKTDLSYFEPIECGAFALLDAGYLTATHEAVVAARHHHQECNRMYPQNCVFMDLADVKQFALGVIGIMASSPSLNYTIDSKCFRVYPKSCRKQLQNLLTKWTNNPVIGSSFLMTALMNGDLFLIVPDHPDTRKRRILDPQPDESWDHQCLLKREAGSSPPRNETDPLTDDDTN